MFLLVRVLFAWTMAAPLAQPILIALWTGQIRLHGQLIKRKSHALLFGIIVAVNLVFALFS
jgi:hypothetical protein